MSITSEDKKILMKEAHKKTIDTGKYISIGKLIYEQIKPYLVDLRNGTSRDIKQDTKPLSKSEEAEAKLRDSVHTEVNPEAPANRNMMDFSDLDLD